jgi:FMN phosphatase YigB (HAD superfamily)
LAAPSFPKSQRAVIFDLWDTLTEPHAQRNRGRYTEEVGEILGAGGEVFSDLVAATFTERCRGELGDLRSTLRELCRRLGVEPTSPALEAAAAHRMDAQARLLQFRDDAVTVVERFRSHRWLTGLLTDSTCETEALWQQMELRHLFDAAAFSCAEGRSKPDPSFYDVVGGASVSSRGTACTSPMAGQQSSPAPPVWACDASSWSRMACHRAPRTGRA